MAQPLAAPYSYFADQNGAPLAGGKVYTYAAGTTTPAATYTDSTGDVPASNPIILDSAGRATIWGNGAYKIVVKDANGVQVGLPADNVFLSASTGDMSSSIYDPGNVEEQLVGLTAVQTLSNKTLVGTSTDDDAATGDVGEYVTATQSSATSVGLFNNTLANVISISLTAGDWDVWGNIIYSAGSSTMVNLLQGGIGQTSAVIPPAPAGGYAIWAGSVTGAAQSGLSITPTRISLASATTVYLVTVGTFSVSTLNAYGSISARRVR